MGSLNAPGILVVSKQNVGWRSLGRNIVVTSGTNPYQQASVRAPGIMGVPADARSAADFGTQSTPATESFLQMGFVKHTESVDDTTVKKVLGDIAPDAGNQPEIALINTTTKREDHRGNRIVEQDTRQDTVLRRISNEGTRPGGEI
ncbi:hypothetical protein E4G67_00030 [Candidatus Bathyarchaeota archaeon]|nr:MAG: hypothetical protein E4G67_00030 [Candidatus Bathyarchaeota archaeon]